MEFERLVVFRILHVNSRAILLDGYLHVGGRAARKLLRIEDPRRLRCSTECHRQRDAQQLHRAAPIARRPAQHAWQMATASASLASSDSTGDFSPSRLLTINCTWCFSARP